MSSQSPAAVGGSRSVQARYCGRAERLGLKRRRHWRARQRLGLASRWIVGAVPRPAAQTGKLTQLERRARTARENSSMR